MFAFETSKHWLAHRLVLIANKGKYREEQGLRGDIARSGFSQILRLHAVSLDGCEA